MKDDGGPAFGRAEWIGREYFDDIKCQYKQPIHSTEGMTLRDWFAGHAMIAIVRNNKGFANATIEVASRLSYDLADAMIEASKK